MVRHAVILSAYCEASLKRLHSIIAKLWHSAKSKSTETIKRSVVVRAGDTRLKRQHGGPSRQQVCSVGCCTGRGMPPDIFQTYKETASRGGLLKTGLWVTVVCQCRPLNRDQHVTVMADADNQRGGCCWEVGTGKCSTFPSVELGI